MKRSLALLRGVAFRSRIGNQWTNRAGRISARYLPVESVLFTLIADEFQGVTPGRFASPHGRGILELGIHQGIANLDGVVLVGSYAAIQNLIFPTFGVEIPATG